MANRQDGAFAYLGPDRVIGIDYGSGDVTTEAEFKKNPDGSVTLIDIRETPTMTTNEKEV
jgi:ubiquinone/menaquinone biosynthesis C-methylase UbiE